MPAGHAARAPRASTAASPKKQPPNRAAPPAGAALASKPGKNGDSRAANFTTKPININTNTNTKPGHPSSTIAMTNSHKDAPTTNSDSKGVRAIQALQQQLNDMTKGMHALQAELQQMQLLYQHHDEQTNTTTTTNDDEPPTKDQTTRNRKDQKTTSNRKQQKTNPPEGSTSIPIPEGSTSIPIPRSRGQRRTTPEPLSGTTENTAPPETKTPVGHDIKHGTPKLTAAYNTDLSDATENTTAGTDVRGDPSIGRKSAEPRIPAQQGAQRVPTVKEETTGAGIIAQQEAGQKRTRKGGAANRTAGKPQSEREQAAAAEHQREREQISSSNLHMILAFLQENGGRKLANHIRMRIRAGETDEINAQLQAASGITRACIKNINDSNGTPMQTAQELMIHAGTQAIRICERMGFIGGCTAHQMETRIMEAAERVAEMTRAILQELTAAAEPGFHSRRFVQVTGQRDRHQRNAYNQARQRKLQLEELARKAPEMEQHELQEGVQQAVTSLYYKLKRAAYREAPRSTAAQRMAEVLQKVTAQITDIVKRHTWSNMPHQLKSELLNTAGNIAEAEAAEECDVQRAVSYIGDMATTLFRMQSEWVERETDEGTERHATELDGAQITATIGNIRASLADCKHRRQAAHMRRFTRDTAIKAAMQQWRARTTTGDVKKTAACGRSTQETAEQSATRERCWRRRVTHHLLPNGTQPEHQKRTQVRAKTYREAATGGATGERRHGSEASSKQAEGARRAEDQQASEEPLGPLDLPCSEHS